MAHASGNPTWQPFPDKSTLVTADALEAIENTLDTALDDINGLDQVRPVCELRLTADYMNLIANTWLPLRGQMAVPTGMDPFGMVSKPSNPSDAPYRMTIPAGWAGRYELVWQCAVDGTGYDPLLVVGLLNAPANVTAAQTFDYIWCRNHAPGMGTVVGSAVFAAGDWISLAVYCSRASGGFNLRALLGSYHRTKAVLRYLGPG